MDQRRRTTEEFLLDQMIGALGEALALSCLCSKAGIRHDLTSFQGFIEGNYPIMDRARRIAFFDADREINPLINGTQPLHLDIHEIREDQETYYEVKTRMSQEAVPPLRYVLNGYAPSSVQALLQDGCWYGFGVLVVQITGMTRAEIKERLRRGSGQGFSLLLNELLIAQQVSSNSYRIFSWLAEGGMTVSGCQDAIYLDLREYPKSVENYRSYYDAWKV